MKWIYSIKMTKRTLRVLPVVFLSLFCLMLIVFGCVGAIRESGRIQVGVVVPRGDMMTKALVDTVKNMGEFSSLCDFSLMEEKEGKQKLEQGEISALIVVPKDILQKIYRNDKTSISLYAPDRPTLESAIIREFAEAGTSLVLTAKAGDYTAYQMYQKYGKAGSMRKVAQDMNGRYIQFVMQQELLFENQVIDDFDQCSDEDRMVAAGVALILFLLGIPVISLRKSQSAILSLQLARKGIRPMFCILLDECLIALILFVPMFTGTLILGSILEWEMAVDVLFRSLLCGCLMYSAFLLMLQSFGHGTTGVVLMIFFAAFVQIFLAGGIFPVSVLPAFLVRVGNILPGGLMMKFIHEGIAGGKYMFDDVWVYVYGVLFLAAALCMMTANRRKCA